MQKIVPHLWYDTQAGEAAELYTRLFPDSRIKSRTKIQDTPSGTVETLTISLMGLDFILLSAGPYFKFTPAISFLVACDTKEEVGKYWSTLREGGGELMPLGSYPFSEHYGWLSDKFGLSWQIMLMGDMGYSQKITPTLMFTGQECGKAEEAMSFYTKLLQGSSIKSVLRYGPGAAPDAENSVKHGEFKLSGLGFAAMDSAYEHGFSFNEAISLMVHCENQDEIDLYWNALSAHPAAEQCGWLKDRYGLSWQIVPTTLDTLMGGGKPEQRARVTEAFLKMKKFDIAALVRAYEDK
jgi:predicted 3-demethylubiquinone-9 3-methyltransferase (glyoxalase superfamily)